MPEKRNNLQTLAERLGRVLAARGGKGGAAGCHNADSHIKKNSTKQLSWVTDGAFADEKKALSFGSVLLQRNSNKKNSRWGGRLPNHQNGATKAQEN